MQSCSSGQELTSHCDIVTTHHPAVPSQSHSQAQGKIDSRQTWDPFLNSLDPAYYDGEGTCEYDAGLDL